jgi:hypothetical protein
VRALVLDPRGISSPWSRGVRVFEKRRLQISGWAPTVNPMVAIIAVDRSREGAIYAGLANGTANFLYGRIEAVQKDHNDK